MGSQANTCLLNVSSITGNKSWISANLEIIMWFFPTSSFPNFALVNDGTYFKVRIFTRIFQYKVQLLQFLQK